MPFPRKPMGQLKALLCGMAWSPFLPLMCCIILDKSLSLSKPLLFHQQNGKRTVPHQFTDGHKTCGGKQQAHPSGHYTHPSWHCHTEHRASNWDFLWAQESGSPWQDPGCHQGALRAAGAVVELGSTPRTPCQPLHSALPAAMLCSLRLLALLGEWIQD